MQIVCFGQQNWDVCRTAKQHLLTRLARRGHEVLYVDPLPCSQKPTGLTQRADRLWTLTQPASPRLLKRLEAPRRRRLLLRTLRTLGFHRPVALVHIPNQRWLVRAIDPVAVHYLTFDEWTQYAGLTDEQRAMYRREEEVLLQQSDMAAGVSPRLVERFRKFQPAAYLQENAVEAERFSPDALADIEEHPALGDIPHPRLGFVGQVDQRLDTPLLAGLARSRPEWQFVLTGRATENFNAAPLEGLTNVHLLGYQPYETLPSVLKGYDVCLVPYHLTPLTQACNPLKAYEYLATGKPVVATPLEGLNACREVVTLAGSPEDFLRACDEAVADPGAGRARRLAMAGANTWDTRAELLERKLEEAVAHAVQHGRRMPRLIPSGDLPDSPELEKPDLNLRRAGFISPPPLRLDAKEHAEFQLHDGWSHKTLSPKMRLMLHATRGLGWAYFCLRWVTRLMLRKRPLSRRRILIVRAAALGDLIAFLPTLAAVRRRFQHAHITLGVHRGFNAAILLEGAGLVDDIRVLDFLEQPSRLARLRGWWAAFRQGYDLMLTGVHYFLIRESLFLGTPFRFGVYDGHPWQRLNTANVPLQPDAHEAENNLRLIEGLGGSALGDERMPRLTLPPDELDRQYQKAAGAMGFDALRQDLSREEPTAEAVSAGAESQPRLILVHTGSKRPSRRWPPERFAELISRLLYDHPDARVVLTGVPDERGLAESVRSLVEEPVRDRVINGAGGTDLRGLLGLMSRAALMVSNDTGTLHVARAMGTPLLAVLGPENDARWGPHPLGPGACEAVRVVVPCAPCVRWECEPHYCMMSLGVDAAYDAAGRLLRGETGGTLTSDLTRRTWYDLAAAGFVLPVVRVRRGAINGQTYPAIVGLTAAPDAEADLVADALAASHHLDQSVASLVRSPQAAAARAGRVWRAAPDPADAAERGVVVRAAAPWSGATP